MTEIEEAENQILSVIDHSGSFVYIPKAWSEILDKAIDNLLLENIIRVASEKEAPMNSSYTYVRNGVTL